MEAPPLSASRVWESSTRKRINAVTADLVDKSTLDDEYKERGRILHSRSLRDKRLKRLKAPVGQAGRGRQAVSKVEVGPKS